MRVPSHAGVHRGGEARAGTVQLRGEATAGEQDDNRVQGDAEGEGAGGSHRHRRAMSKPRAHHAFKGVMAVELSLKNTSIIRDSAYQSELHQFVVHETTFCVEKMTRSAAESWSVRTVRHQKSLSFIRWPGRPLSRLLGGYEWSSEQS